MQPQTSHDCPGNTSPFLCTRLGKVLSCRNACRGLTACDVATVLKYSLQAKRLHGCQSERFLSGTAEAIARCKCRKPWEVAGFFDTGRGTGADILALTFGGWYENLQQALANWGGGLGCKMQDYKSKYLYAWGILAKLGCPECGFTRGSCSFQMLNIRQFDYSLTPTVLNANHGKTWKAPIFLAAFQLIHTFLESDSLQVVIYDASQYWEGFKEVLEGLGCWPFMLVAQAYILLSQSF